MVPRKMILKLLVRYTDGSEEIIVSDSTWMTSPSPVTFTSIYGGEDYDARLEQEKWNKVGFNGISWKESLEVREPSGELKPEMDHPLRIMQEFGSAVITCLNDSVCIYDFGQNTSGIVRLKVKGKKGQVVRLVPGELISDDTLVTQKASGEPYYFTYTLKGDGEETWVPRFSYYGFRYVRQGAPCPTVNLIQVTFLSLQDCSFFIQGTPPLPQAASDVQMSFSTQYMSLSAGR